MVVREEVVACLEKGLVGEIQHRLPFYLTIGRYGIVPSYLGTGNDFVDVSSQILDPFNQPVVVLHSEKNGINIKFGSKRCTELRCLSGIRRICSTGTARLTYQRRRSFTL